MSKWTIANIPSQTGTTALVTGANSGLGLETARELARAGARVVLAVRDPQRGERAVADIQGSVPDARVEVHQLDLGSLDAVADSAAALHDRVDHLDLLVNNAGVMYPPKQLTADGFELQFGTNHLGHFAFTGQVLDLLTDTAESRVVVVASIAHNILSDLDLDDVNWEKKRYNRVAAYGRSKLANLLFTYELQRRLETAKLPTIALAAHPGISDTELVRHVPAPDLIRRGFSKLLFQPAELGALPTLRAATDPAVQGAEYYGPDGIGEIRGHPKLVRSNAKSHDLAMQQRLWSLSEELTGVSYPV